MMSVFHRLAAVAACLTAVGAMGVSGAATASASSTFSSLCISSGTPVRGGVFNGGTSFPCAVAAGSNAVKVVQSLPASGPQPAITNFFYPGTAGKFEQFRQAGTNSCLQLDHAAGNKVIMAGCNKSHPSYQMWAPTFGSNSNGGFAVYVSGYDRSVGLCLTFDEQNRSARTGILTAVKCTPRAWYQEFQQ